MEEHPDQASAEARFLRDILVDYTFDNVFCLRASVFAFVVTYFKRFGGHCTKQEDTREKNLNL
jgi:hypothetical protein